MIAGTGFNGVTSDGSPVTVFPQPSVTIGGGTVIELVVSQMNGQFGLMRLSVFVVLPKLQPAGVPPVVLPDIHGCVNV